LSCLRALRRLLRILFDSFKVGTRKTKTVAPFSCAFFFLFTPSLSVGGEENQSVSSHGGGCVWLFVSAGGREAGRQTGRRAE